MGSWKILTIAAVVSLSVIWSGSASAEPAVRVDEFGCFLPGSVSGLSVDLFTTDTHSVITSSGNTVLKCKFEIPDGFEPNKALNNSDFLCNTFLGLTEISKSTSSPGGNAILTCEVKGNS